MNQLNPITRSAVETRLNPLGWPADADAADGAFRPYNDAAGAAQAVYAAFQAHAATTQANLGLTDVGKRLANHEFAKDNLPALRDRLAKIQARAAETIESATASMTTTLTAPAVEPQDIALLAEIRTWLRTMPQAQRTQKVLELSSSGDRAALRAVLTAPAYLTGIDTELLATVRETVAKTDHPERFAKLQAVRRAAEYAERALDGVIRYIEIEGTALGTRPSVTSEAA